MVARMILIEATKFVGVVPHLKIMDYENLSQ